ncbi:MAG: hypothetical protein N2V72_08590, partial [Methanophagales archaeon]|nr:hypothetical protein [Methanophagales archaeon]
LKQAYFVLANRVDIALMKVFIIKKHHYKIEQNGREFWRTVGVDISVGYSPAILFLQDLLQEA